MNECNAGNTGSQQFNTGFYIPESDKPTIDGKSLRYAGETVKRVDFLEEEIGNVLDFFVSDVLKNSISLNIGKIKNREMFIMILEKFFQSYYFEINYDAFQDLIYNFDNYKEKNIPVSIASGIKEFDKVEFNAMFRMFSLQVVSRDEVKEINGGTEIKSSGRVDCILPIVNLADRRLFYDFGQVVAICFLKGVRYGLDKETIITSMNLNRRVNSFATSRVPKEGKNANLQQRVEFFPAFERGDSDEIERKFGIKDSIRTSVKSVPQIEVLEGQSKIIALKTKPSVGEHGIGFDGNIIPGLKKRDIYPDKEFVGEGVEMIDNGSNLVRYQTSISGHLIVETDGKIDGKPKVKKISVSKQWRHEGIDIGKDTGNMGLLIISETVLGKGVNIAREFKVFCNSLTMEGGAVEGHIYSQEGNIEVNGNVLAGRIEEYDGDIAINGDILMYGSHLEAPKGKITVKKAQFAEIIGDDIYIEEAYGCKISGRNVRIGKVVNCDVEWKETLEIGEVCTEAVILEAGENGAVRQTGKDTNLVFLGKGQLISRISAQFEDQKKLAAFISEHSKDTELEKTLKAIEKAERFNRDAQLIGDKNEGTNLGNIGLKIGKISNFDYLLLYYANFHDIDITKLNSQGREFKEKFLHDLLGLLKVQKSLKDLSITQIKIENGEFSRDGYELFLDREDLKQAIKRESKKVNVGRLKPVPGSNPDNINDLRYSFRVPLKEDSEVEEGLKEGRFSGERIMISSGGISKFGILRDISAQGISFYLKDTPDVRELLFFEEDGEITSLEDRIIQLVRIQLGTKKENGKEVPIYSNSRLDLIKIIQEKGFFVLRGQLIFIGDDQENFLSYWRKQEKIYRELEKVGIQN